VCDEMLPGPYDTSKPPSPLVVVGGLGRRMNYVRLFS
jgi:hypothetical protein